MKMVTITVAKKKKKKASSRSNIQCFNYFIFRIIVQLTHMMQQQQIKNEKGVQGVGVGVGVRYTNLQQPYQTPFLQMQKRHQRNHQQHSLATAEEPA